MRDAYRYIAHIHVPSARVGYAIGRSCDSPGMFIMKTEDGGASWTASRAVAEESGQESHLFFTDEQRGLPCHDRGYVVGGHGMIYRYRVILESAPVAPRSIAGPVMGPPVEAQGAAR